MSPRVSPSTMKKPGLRIWTSLYSSPTKSTRRTPRSAELHKLLRTPLRPAELYLELVRNADRRNRKLDRILGSKDSQRPRIDSCSVDQAFQHGLAGCLSSTRVFPYLLDYLLEENILEELLFVVKVEHYERFPFQSFSERAEEASSIFDAYLHPAGLLYLDSISPTVRTVTRDIIARCVQSESLSISCCFNSAKLQVWDRLEEFVVRFRTESSASYSLLVRDFGLHSIQFSHAALDPVLRRIIGLVAPQATLLDLRLPTAGNSSSVLPFAIEDLEMGLGFEDRRAKMISRLVLEVLRDRLLLN